MNLINVDKKVIDVGVSVSSSRATPSHPFRTMGIFPYIKNPSSELGVAPFSELESPM